MFAEEKNLIAAIRCRRILMPTIEEDSKETSVEKRKNKL